MLIFIRFTALLSLILSVALFLGCGEASPFAGKHTTSNGL